MSARGVTFTTAEQKGQVKEVERVLVDSLASMIEAGDLGIADSERRSSKPLGDAEIAERERAEQELNRYREHLEELVEDLVKRTLDPCQGLVPRGGRHHGGRLL